MELQTRVKALENRVAELEKLLEGAKGVGEMDKIECVKSKIEELEERITAMEAVTQDLMEEVIIKNLVGKVIKNLDANLSETQDLFLEMTALFRIVTLNSWTFQQMAVKALNFNKEDMESEFNKNLEYNMAEFEKLRAKVREDLEKARIAAKKDAEDGKG